MARRALVVGLFVLCSMVGWMGAGSPAMAQERSFVVEGQVTNATFGIGAVDGLAVALHSVNELNLLETATDAQGRFQFDGVVIDPGVEYQVTVSYQGVLYGTALDLSAGSPSPVSVTIYEATNSDDVISLSSVSVLFASVDKSTRSVTALEIVQLVNDSDHTYVPDPQSMDLIRFGLPEGTHGLQVDTSLVGADFVQVDKGFALLASVPPGEHELMFTYRFPYTDATFPYSRSFPHGATRLRVLAPVDIMTLYSDQLSEPETVTIGDRVYNLLQAADLPRGARVSLDLQGLPQPSLTDRLNRRLDSVRFEFVAPIGLGFFMLLLIAFALRKRPGASGGSGVES